METQKFEVITNQSTIAWTGRKVSGAHTGIIAIEAGSIDFTNDQLSGGKLTIDVTSIKVLDITDPVSNAQLTRLLASDSFFSSALYPSAVFEIYSAAKKSDTLYTVTGNLTIKGITHPSHFEVEIFCNSQNLTALGKIVVDRTLYNIKYKSGNFFQNLGDTLIYNDFELDFNLTAQAVPSLIYTSKYDSRAIHQN